MIENDYTSLVQQLLDRRRKLTGSSSYVRVYENWYRGKVPTFHRYKIYNGKSYNYRNRKSMKMAKQCCEDWASLLMNEKVEIVVKDKEKMEELLMKLDFWTKANNSVEYGFALSMSALVLSVDGINATLYDNGEIVADSFDDADVYLDILSIKRIIPITWQNRKIVECAFVMEDNDKEKVISLHMVENKQYVIKTVYYNVETNKAVKTITFKTGSMNPWFVIVHPNLVNNLEIDSPYPISVFANATDTLKSMDTKYDSYDVEFTQGKKRTYVSTKLNRVDPDTGQIVSTFDPEDTVVYQLPEGTSINGEEKPLIVNVSDSLRTAEHSQAIQDELNYFSKQVGLGIEYYKFEKGRVMTATQVISEKSDTFRNLKKHETIFEKALITLIKSLMYICNTFTTKYDFANPDEVAIMFDDSIIEDKNTEKENSRKDLDSGVISPVEFRMKWYGEDEETATANIQKFSGDPLLLERAKKYVELVTTGAITWLDYVKNVYPDLEKSKQEQLAAELKEQASASGGVSPEDLLSGGIHIPTNK